MIDSFFRAFVAWCRRTDDAARLERTLAEGVLGVVLAGLATGEWGASSLTAAAIAVLTPTLAWIGGGNGADNS